MRSTRLVALLACVALACTSACSSNSSNSSKKETGTTGDGAVTHRDSSTGVDQGGTKKKVEGYVPASNEVAGWAEDTATGKAGVEAAYDRKAMSDLVDGHSDEYANVGAAGVAREFYKKDLGTTCQGDSKITLDLWEMNTAAGAKQMYDFDVNADKTTSGRTFTDLAGVTDAGVVSAFDATYKAYAYKHQYVVVLEGQPADVTQPCQTAMKAEVETFIKAVTGKLP